MKSIYKRELKSYFESMVGYSYLAIFFALTAYYFVVNNLLGQSNDVKEYFSTMITTLLFLIPILTMRLLSEEKKLKTDQLLFTIPLSVKDILFGKFLAAFTVFVMGIILTFAFVVTLVFFGNVELYTVIGCYMGILIAGLCFIALGVFLSSLTENQTVAAIVTYAILFGLYLINMLGNYVSNPFWLSVIDGAALFRRYENFTMGIFDPGAIYYYLSLTVLFLMGTGVMMVKSAHKKTKMFAYLAGLLAIAVLSNVFVSGLVKKYNWEVDTTSSGLYQIGEETRELVETLDKEVNIFCICKSRDAILEFSKMLDLYDASSEYIKVTYVDPYSDLVYLDQLKEEGVEAGLNTILVESQGRRKVLPMADMYQFNNDGTKLVYFNGEAMLTSAVMNVSSEQQNVMGVLMGHGEETPTEIQNLVMQNGYEPRGVILNQAIPGEMQLLLMLAPQSDYTQEELAYLDQYFENGNSLLCFYDPSVEELPNLEKFLKEWGIEFEKTVIFDGKHNVEGTPVNLISYYVDHPITTYFKTHPYYTAAPACSSISQDFQNSRNAKVEVVLTSSDDAYGRAANTQQFTTERLAEDTKGPFVLAVTSSTSTTDAKGNQKEGKLFAMGCKRVYSDEMLRLSSVGNAKFMMKVLEWGAEKEGTYFSISPKQAGAEPIAVMPQTAYVLGAVFVGGIPLLILIRGIYVFFKRRYL